MAQSFDILSPAPSALWTFIPIIAFLLLLAGSFGYFLYSSYHTTVEVTSSTLRIKGALYSRSIPLADIVVTDAEVVDLGVTKQFAPKLRTNGIGVPGYQAGWFKLENGRKALLHVTKKSNVLVLPTVHDYDVLLSIAEAEAFLDRLR
jgi:hypothetical protein